MTIKYLQLGLSISGLNISSPEELERLINAIHTAATGVVAQYSDLPPDLSTDIFESAGELDSGQSIDDLQIYGGEWRYQASPKQSDH